MCIYVLVGVTLAVRPFMIINNHKVLTQVQFIFTHHIVKRWLPKYGLLDVLHIGHMEAL